jgi:hypothetical protein
MGVSFCLSVKVCRWFQGLFFFGHMSWGVVWASLFAKETRSRDKLFFPAILMSSILPDLDAFLVGYGVAHHSFFHSILFWVALFLPVFIIFRWKAAPYFVAVLQHFAFGDLLVGEVMLFWPFDLSYFGNISTLFSLFDVVLEIAGLVLMFSILYFSKDLKSYFSGSLNSVWVFLPLAALVLSMLYYTIGWPIVPLIEYTDNLYILVALVFGHLILASFLVVSFFQGLRKLQFG